MIKLQQVMTAMRKMSSELELSKAQFGELTELIGIASMIVDSNGGIVSINETAAAMIGFKPEDLVDTLLTELVIDGRRELDEILIPSMKSGQLESFDLVLRGRTGRKSPLCVVPQPIEHTDGVTRSMLLVFTEKSNHNALLQTLQRSESQLQQFSNRLIAAHEVELKRVSSELHDGLGQALTMIKFMVEDVSRHIKDGEPELGSRVLDETVELLREAMCEVRRISLELRPSSLDDLGLIPTIEWHCRNFQRAYRNLSLKLDLNVIEAEIPKVLKLDIYRIIQEALNNVAKHANASEIVLSLRVEHASLLLIIQDNGSGFDANQLYFEMVNRCGLGLKSMNERVESTGGVLLIQSGNGGTTVDARWALQAVVSDLLPQSSSG